MRLRTYTAMKDGIPVRRGTFSDEGLLRKDFPEPEYQLYLDEFQDIPSQIHTYADFRRFEYPSTGEQLKALWEILGEIAPDNPKVAAWIETLNKTKRKYPKLLEPK